ncbi:hypothetical protein [Cellulomonas triticagri]|uniref:Uncharacterized protein n=1 Tax=Cellulomonas triticagri TaxID=2483352 RepID=A0A3M2JN19_9CELL|nr:hypothetical protein [Cellulomonas triticagri]RMI13676.1 hypothetical protein EBM89_03480 [Cellulomonas triticagri]
MAAGVLLLALTACGPVNRGTSIAEDLEDALRGAPGVTSVDAGGQNPLPWSGTATGTVLLDPDADPADVAAAVALAEQQVRDADGDLAVTVVQDVAGTATEVALAPDSWVWADLRAVRDAAAAATGEGTLAIRPTSATTEVEASVADPAALAPVFGALLDLPVWRAGTALAVTAPDGAALTARPVDADATAAFRALTAAGVPVRSGSLNGTAGWLRVPPEHEAVARAALDALPGDLAVTVTGAAPTSTTGPTSTPAPDPTGAPRPTRTPRT